MKDFEEILKTLPKPGRSYTYQIGRKRTLNYVRLGKPVFTPEGDFESVTKAAEHHKVSKAHMSIKVRRGDPGYGFIE